MYRILIADDEGLMLESLKNMISSQYGAECEIETAKTGRAVIEKAETFHPDIVFMDIHMPGINGIQAMKEIRKFNNSALFYVISAYDKFDYAKEAIDLGVEKYLTKPISKKTVLSVVEEAMEKVNASRRQRSNLLKIQEKLETVIPVVENGFVSSIMFQHDIQDVNNYLQLLDIEELYAFIMVIEFGKDYENGHLISPVGMNVKAQTFYPELRELVKSQFDGAIVGYVMSNRVVVIMPHQEANVSYEERSMVIERGRDLASRLENYLEARFRIGIGKTRPIEDLEKSYRQAIRALQNSHSRIIHIDDILENGVFDDSYPAETEKRMFRMMENGNRKGMEEELNRFYDWMLTRYPEEQGNIRLKVLEFVIRAERIAFESGVINYSFSYRKDYLDIVTGIDNFEDLRQWFLDKMTAVCRMIKDQKEEKSDSAVKRAKAYIDEFYGREISLDEVSKEVNISPYYFSKIFKEEAGENFIEYLTRVRIERAKEMLEQPDFSVKEVSLQCGYSDPNYFSRIFKKQTDMTPSEYKTKYGRDE